MRAAPVHYGGGVPANPLGGGGGDAMMLSRVNQSLSEVVWQPQGYSQQGDIDYEQRSIGDLKQQFAHNPTPRSRQGIHPVFLLAVTLTRGGGDDR